MYYVLCILYHRYISINYVLLQLEMLYIMYYIIVYLMYYVIVCVVY